MTPHPGLSVYHVLFAVYVACALCLNGVMYLISAFYQKKFSQPSPRAGFMLAMILGVLLIVSVFVRIRPGEIIQVVQSTLLIGGGIASGWNGVSLYYTMKQVSK